MALEDLTGAAKFINALVAGNPLLDDDKREGDDHIRGIKNVLKNQFPNLTAAVTATAAQLNAVTTALQAANNLSDVSNAFTSRANLGLHDANGRWAMANPPGGGNTLSINGAAVPLVLQRSTAGIIANYGGTHTSEGSNITVGTDASDNPNVGWLDWNWQTGNARFEMRVASAPWVQVTEQRAISMPAPATGITLSLGSVSGQPALAVSGPGRNLYNWTLPDATNVVQLWQSGTTPAYQIRAELTHASMWFDWYVPGVGSGFLIDTAGPHVPVGAQPASAAVNDRVPNTQWCAANLTGHASRANNATGRTITTNYTAPAWPTLQIATVKETSGTGVATMDALVGGVVMAQAVLAISGMATLTFWAPAGATVRVNQSAGAGVGAMQKWVEV